MSVTGYRNNPSWYGLMNLEHRTSLKLRWHEVRQDNSIRSEAQPRVSHPAAARWIEFTKDLVLDCRKDKGLIGR